MSACTTCFQSRGAFLFSYNLYISLIPQGIVHRDLGCENSVLNVKLNIKIIDIMQGTSCIKKFARYKIKDL